MVIGRVVGNVWATRKLEELNGLKFMIVELSNGDSIVACDAVGAGVGEQVLIFKGSSARQSFGFGDLPVDAAIIGIIDEREGE